MSMRMAGTYNVQGVEMDNGRVQGRERDSRRRGGRGIVDAGEGLSRELRAQWRGDSERRREQDSPRRMHGHVFELLLGF